MQSWIILKAERDTMAECGDDYGKDDRKGPIRLLANSLAAQGNEHEGQQKPRVYEFLRQCRHRYLKEQPLGHQIVRWASAREKRDTALEDNDAG